MFDFNMLSMLTMSIRYGSLLIALRLQDLLRNPTEMMKDTAGLMAKLKTSLGRLSPAGLSLSIAAFFFTPSLALAPLLSTYGMIAIGAGVLYGVVMLVSFLLAYCQAEDHSADLGASLLRWTLDIMEFCAVSGIAMLVLYGVAQLLMAYSGWQLATVLSAAYIATFVVLLLTEFMIDSPGILKGCLPESAQTLANDACSRLVISLKQAMAPTPTPR
jgi:hypothetical protein